MSSKNNQLKSTKSPKPDIIGSNAFVDIFSIKNIPAKIDTGADSSAIHASDIKVTRDHILKFKLFAPGSPYYTGKVIKRKDFRVGNYTSSSGHSEIRYRAALPIKLHGRRFRVLFSLTDRSKNKFPVLIGRRTLRNKFIVDVSQRPIKTSQGSLGLNEKLQKNPRQFYLKQKRGKIVL